MRYSPCHHLQASGDSLSAEHGSGSKRIGAITAMTYGITLAVTGQVQRLLDPRGLINLGKVFSA